MAETQSTEPHALSDSEPDLHITEKKLPRKSKTSAHNESRGASGHAHSVLVPGTTPNVSSVSKAQDNNELAEMRSMFKEMKALTEENSAFMEKFAEYSQFEQGNSQLASGR